jgi:hypothetical protein
VTTGKTVRSATFKADAFDSTECLYKAEGTGEGIVVFYGFGYWDVTTTFDDLPAPCINPIKVGDEFSLRVGQVFVEIGVGVDYTTTVLGPFTYGDAFSAGGVNFGYGGGFKGKVTHVAPIPSGPYLPPASERS